jgi:hypothetical protein
MDRSVENKGGQSVLEANDACHNRDVGGKSGGFPAPANGLEKHALFSGYGSALYQLERRWWRHKNETLANLNDCIQPLPRPTYFIFINPNVIYVIALKNEG